MCLFSASQRPHNCDTNEPDRTRCTWTVGSAFRHSIVKLPTTLVTPCRNSPDRHRHSTTTAPPAIASHRNRTAGQPPLAAALVWRCLFRTGHCSRCPHGRRSAAIGHRWDAGDAAPSQCALPDAGSRSTGGRHIFAATATAVHCVHADRSEWADTSTIHARRHHDGPESDRSVRALRRPGSDGA